MKHNLAAALNFLISTVVLLAVSLVVHASTYFGFNIRDDSPFIWMFLQFAVIIGFIPKIVSSLSKHLGSTPSPHPQPYIWGSAKYEKQSPWEFCLMVFFGLGLGYAIMNFVYWDPTASYPYINNGQYYIYFPSGGRTRSIIAEQYTASSLYFARRMSGHWIICHVLALMWLYEDLKAPPHNSLNPTLQ